MNTRIPALIILAALHPGCASNTPEVPSRSAQCNGLQQHRVGGSIDDVISALGVPDGQMA